MKKMLFDALFKKLAARGFSVKYWDGDEVAYGGKPEFALLFRKEPALDEGRGDICLCMGNAYIHGDLEIEGNFTAVAGVLEAASRHGTLAGRAAAAVFPLMLRMLPRTKELARQKQNIQAHYDLGNDFFSLWLDPSMSYSCAYFRHPEDSLEQAQSRKIDLILRKIRLVPGMRLLDIGCGWGHLIVRAAEDYGARAVGITLSEDQYAAVRRSVEEKGLQGKVEVRLQNYLEFEEGESFDRIVSVGMFEHVGQRHISRYFDKVCSLLQPRGLSLLHTLTKQTERAVNAWSLRYIFPGGYIPSLREVVHALPSGDFHVQHVESLRRHYARTLEKWYENFSAATVQKKVVEMFGEPFARMWSLYLRMAAAFLRAGGLDVHQIVFSKGVNNELPMTLEDIYHP